MGKKIAAVSSSFSSSFLAVVSPFFPFSLSLLLLWYRHYGTILLHFYTVVVSFLLLLLWWLPAPNDPFPPPPSPFFLSVSPLWLPSSSHISQASPLQHTKGTFGGNYLGGPL